MARSEAKARQRVVEAACAYKRAYDEHALAWRVPLGANPPDREARPTIPNFWRPLETRDELFDAVFELDCLQRAEAGND